MLNAAISNDHAVLKGISEPATLITFFGDFRVVIVQHFFAYVQYTKVRAVTRLICPPETFSFTRTTEETIELNILLQNNGKTNARSYFSKLLTTIGRAFLSQYSCSACRPAFQVSCIALYQHYTECWITRPEVYRATIRRGAAQRSNERCSVLTLTLTQRNAESASVCKSPKIHLVKMCCGDR